MRDGSPVPSVAFVHGHLPFLLNLLDISQLDLPSVERSRLRPIDIVSTP